MRWRFIATLVLCCAFGTGCAMVQPAHEAFSDSMDSLKPKSQDYRDPSDQTGEEWNIVGEEGRGHMAPERDPDPWWQRLVMSPKARSIERNLGIQDP